MTVFLIYSYLKRLNIHSRNKGNIVIFSSYCNYNNTVYNEFFPTETKMLSHVGCTFILCTSMLSIKLSCSSFRSVLSYLLAALTLEPWDMFLFCQLAYFKIPHKGLLGVSIRLRRKGLSSSCFFLSASLNSSLCKFIENVFSRSMACPFISQGVYLC